MPRTDPPKLLTPESLKSGTRALRRKDPAFRVWRDRIGTVTMRRQRHYFGTLCRTICSQQLAAQAAITIHGRFCELFSPRKRPDPLQLLELKDEQLWACGLSKAKAKYLRALAEAFHDGPLAKLRFSKLSNDDIVAALTEVPGIGVWSAEMFLIFAAGRIDVFSIGDLALRNAVERIEGREMSHAEIVERAEFWSPYRSIASLYLWKIAHWKE